MKTGLVWHERYMWHDTGHAVGFIPSGWMAEPDTHVENPETKRRLRNLLEVSGLLEKLVPIKPRFATEEELLRFHIRDYIDAIHRMSDEGRGDAGEFTPLGPASYEIALLAAGGLIEAVDAVLDGKVNNAYALVRPPGHHAERDRGRGFCVFGNVVLAVMHAQQVRGLGRIAVVDWDVHHGNGTQQAFWSDPSVLTLSVHQDRYYPPDSGLADEIGEGDGEGYCLNVPLPPGSGVGAYEATFERVVLPALRNFEPEMIFVASGFDGSMMDPLGRMMLHSEAYRSMTKAIVAVADELCGGRLVMAHEGGYSTAYVPFCGLAVFEEMSGIRTDAVDPFMPIFSGAGWQELQPHQEAVIDAASEKAASLKPARMPAAVGGGN